MKITNKKGAPQALVNLVESKQFGFTPNSYSATTIIKSPTEVLLQRRHDNEIEADVSEMTATLFGTVTHSWLEQYKDENAMAEIKFKTEIRPGHFLSGVCDIYDSIKHLLIDWKTATVWKIKFGDFTDWHTQAMIYTFLIENEGYQVDKVEFWAFMKDWSQRELRQARLKGDYSYPDAAWYCYEFYPTQEDRGEINAYINNWFDNVIALENKEDNELPYCGDEATWASPKTWAVYKLNNNGSKPVKATKVCKSLTEASDFVGAQKSGNNYVIEERPQEHKKCLDYCNCNKWCPFYKAHVEGKEGM